MGMSMDISMDIPMDIHEKICGYGCGYGWEISYPRQARQACVYYRPRPTSVIVNGCADSQAKLTALNDPSRCQQTYR